MNAASDAPDEGLTTRQIAAAGTGQVPDSPGTPRTLPGAQTARPVQRPAGDGRPAGAGAGEDNRFVGGAADTRDDSQPGTATAAVASTSGGNGFAPGSEPRARLLEGEELERILVRWKEIQSYFVDEPRTAVERADSLVADLMQQLAAMFAGERAELEQRWASGDAVSTEELRQSLRHYRSFFERLLAA